MVSVIGEPLSFTLDPEEVVYHVANRRYYACQQDALLGKPLDFGRMVFYKTWEKFHRDPSVVEIECYHDHHRDRVTAMVKFSIDANGVAKKVRSVRFYEHEYSAPDDIEHLIKDRLEDLEDMIKEAK